MRVSRPMPWATTCDVGADLLADVGDLVDEADLGGEEGVGGVLDHLGRGTRGAHDGRVERRVERGHPVAVRVVERADHDAVGVQEVRDGAPSRRNSGLEQ